MLWLESEPHQKPTEPLGVTDGLKAYGMYTSEQKVINNKRRAKLLFIFLNLHVEIGSFVSHCDM